MTSDLLDKIAPALVAAKAAFRPALKDAVNPHFRSKFVSLGAVHDAIDDALAANDLVALQPTRIGEDGHAIVVTTLLHASGQSISGEYPVTASQPGPQGEGSGLTYARRYALMAMVGIAPEDDDGEAATPQPPRREPAADPAVLGALKAATEKLDSEQHAKLTTAWRKKGLPKLENLNGAQVSVAFGLLDELPEGDPDA